MSVRESFSTLFASASPCALMRFVSASTFAVSCSFFAFCLATSAAWGLRVAVGNGLRVADVLHGHLFDGQADALPFRGERVLHGLRVLATVGEHRDRVELAGGFTGHAAQVVADVVLRERGLLAVFRVEHFGGRTVRANS